MIIAITGTPGTGKTTLAKILMEKLHYAILDVKNFIKEKNISSVYDKVNKCEIIDVNNLNREIIKEIKKVQKEKNPKGIIVDSHLSHYLPKKYVDLVIVAKCDLKVLQKRLKARKYTKNKIRDNLDSEIFDICLNEAKEEGHNTFVIITTKGIKKESISQLIGEINASKSTSARTKRNN